MADLDYLINFNTETGDIARAGRDIEQLTGSLQNIRVGRQGLADINQISNSIQEAGGDVTQLRADLVSLSNSFNSLSTDEQNRQLRELAISAGNLSRSTNNATASMERLFNTRTDSSINAEINQVNTALTTLRQRLNAGTISQEEFNRLTQAGQTRLNALQAELNQTTNALNRNEQSTHKAGNAMKTTANAVNSLQGMLGALGISVGAMELIQLSDQFKTLEAKIKLATGEGANFVTGFEGVKQIANDTFSNISDTGELFTRIARAGQALNMSQNDVLAVTKTINEAVKLSGGTAESNRAAITQLIQGLQSGVLRGEEFNSMMEQSPRLSRAMADGIGVTLGQLRAMANDGKLTSEVVIGAITKQGTVIQDEFDKMPITVGNSLTQLQNGFTIFIGDLDKQLNGSSGVSNAIQGLAKGFDDIDPTAIEAIKQIFSGLGDSVTAIVNNISSAKDKIDDFSNALGGDTGEKVGFLTRTMQGLSIVVGLVADGFKAMGIASDVYFGSIIKGFGYVTEAIAEYFGYTNTFSKAAMAKGDEMLARAKQNALEFQSSAGKALDSASKTQQDLLNETAKKSTETYQKMAGDADVSAEKQQRAAVDAANAIVKANNGVLDEKAKAILAEQNLQGEIDKTGKLQITNGNDVKKSFIDIYTEGKKAGKGIWDSLDDSAKKAKTDADFVDIRAGLMLLGKQGKISGDDMAKGIATANQAQSEFKAKQDEMIAKFGEVAKAAYDSGDKQKIAEMQKQAAAKGLLVVYDEQKNIMISLADTGVKTAQDIKKEYALLEKQLGVDFSKAIIGIGEDFKKSASGIQVLADKTEEFKKAGIDSSVLVIDGLQKMQKEARNDTEYQKLIALWQDMGKQGVISAEQMKKGLEETRAKADELKDGINSTQEAYKTLGIKSQEQLNQQAKDYKQAYEAINKDTTASLQIRQQAFDKYAQAQVDANKGVVSSELKTQATALGYANIVAENGRVSVQTADQIAQANGAVAKSYDNIAVSAEKAGQAQKDSITQWNEELAKQSAKTEEQQQASSNRLLGWMNSVKDAVKQPLSDLQELGVSTEQANQAFDKLNAQSFFVGQRWADFQSWGESMRVVGDEAQRQANIYRENYTAVTNMTTALGDANASTKTITEAQRALNNATKANMFSLIKLDEQTLGNLQKAIDSTKQKLNGLTDTAKSVADNLEAEFARMNGDDSLSRKLEQTRKLTKIQDDLTSAKQRGNEDEITQYERALELQTKINEKENEQVQEKAQKQKADEQAKAVKQADSKATTQANRQIVTTDAVTTATPINATATATATATPAISAKEVVSAFSDQIKQAEARGAQNLARQLMLEAKRQAR